MVPGPTAGLPRRAIRVNLTLRHGSSVDLGKDAAGPRETPFMLHEATEPMTDFPPKRDPEERPDDIPVTVLLAEDNRTNQLVIRKMLSPLPIRLEIVSNGLEAVEAVKANPPDLILMDISMPGMDGKEATRRIRDWQRDQGHPHIPVVAITAHARDADRAEIREAGLDHFLPKPVDREALTDHVLRVQEDLRRKAGASGPSERPAS